jgi:hypothetical protein
MPFKYPSSGSLIADYDVKLGASYGDSFAPTLLCPRCGSEYLQQVPDTLAFECEGCSGDGGALELCIRQHKGNTSLHWHYLHQSHAQPDLLWYLRQRPRRA